MKDRFFSRWVDSHCHFMLEYTDPSELKESFESLSDLEFAVHIGTSRSDMEDVVRNVGQHPHLYGALGIHPHEAQEWGLGLEEQMKEAFHVNPKLLAVGEVGLDYSRDPSSSDKSKQWEVFEKQIQISLDLKKPLVIHARDSIMDCLSILDNFSLALPPVFHCFTGTLKEAESILQREFWLSYTGIITFPKLELLRDIVRITPRDRIMVETDSPFLAPVPCRGKTNRPGWVRYVGEKLAEIWSISVEETRHQTTSNAYRFFGISPLEEREQA